MRGSSHDVSVRDRCGVQPHRHQSGDMGHVHHEPGPDGVGDAAESLEVDNPGVSRVSCHYQLRPVLFRQPLVPGISDSIANIEATADFLIGLGKGGAKLQLMPYHRMGQSKYQALNMPCIMEEVAAADDERVEAVRKAYVARGVNCTISR